MQITQKSPELADAADVLSDQLRVHLQRLAVILLPHAPNLECRFLKKLAKIGYEPAVRASLVTLTPGAAAHILAQGLPPGKFIEQVEYSGRRLAKLNLPPSRIVEALQEYDRLLTPVLRALEPTDYANFQWVREQLHFCVILTLNNAYYQVREGETQAFYELFRVEVESRNLDELLRSFLRTLVEFCHCDAGHLYLLNDTGTAWVRRASTAAQSGIKLRQLNIPHRARQMQRLSKAHQIDLPNAERCELLDPSWMSRFKSCWSIPLAANGRTAGVIQFAFLKPYDWLPREQELLTAAAERCLMAAEKARLMEDLAAREEQVRELAEHMLHVEEFERRRISRELHDEAGQSLLCVRLQMEMLENSLPAEQNECIGRLREVRDLTERTIVEIRRLIADLSPAVLEQLGLGAALRQLVNRFRRVHPVHVKLHLARLGRLPQGTEIIVYRLVQECFNNIAKHSKATTVNISADSADGLVRLNVEDNGVGFNVDEAFAQKDAFGLSGMRERVALFGGDCEVLSHQSGSASTRKKGTKISIVLPVSNGKRRPGARENRQTDTSRQHKTLGRIS